MAFGLCVPSDHPLWQLAKLLRELSDGTITDEEIDAALAEIDLDGSGHVELDEFLPWWRQTGIRRVFARHDADASGTIDATELGMIMVELGISMGAVQRAEVLQQLDVDGSGTISFDEVACRCASNPRRGRHATF